MLKQWDVKLTDLFAGVLSGLLVVIISTAFTALIFKNSLSVYFSVGITSALLGSMLVNLFTSLFSSFRFSIAQVSPAGGAVLGIIFANLVHFPLTPENILPSLLATLALSSFLIGFSMFLLGFFRLGQIARFAPFPVLGGIITGTAWIMIDASFSLMTDNNFSLANLLSPNTAAVCITGIVFSLILLIAQRNFARVWTFPVLILAASILINIFLRLYHFSHADAIHAGWLFQPFEPVFSYKFLNTASWGHVEWNAIFSETDYLASFVVLMIIMLLLNVSSLETVAKEKADLDQELKIAGISNIAGGCLIASPATLSLSATVTNKKAGAKHRIAGVLASVVCALVFIYPAIISYLPKPVISGLLLYTAYTLLMEWLYDGWKKLPKIDYAIVWTILISVAIWDFLTGIFVGIIITCVVFIIRYARIDAIKFSTTGANYHSNVVRPFYQQKWQAEAGNRIQIIKLQGYLFFGSAKLMLDKISNLIESDTQKQIKFLIFDFQYVNGMDSSAIYQFIRLEQLIDHFQIQIIFCNCSEKIKAQFKKQGVTDGEDDIKIFSDLDQAMEWCENDLLKSMPDYLKREDTFVTGTLSQLIPNHDQQTIFKKYLKKFNVPAHSILFKQGDAVDSLYFIESGEVAVFIESDQAIVRVSKSSAGTIVGEIGFYLHTKRTATVRTETDCVIYTLTEASLQKLETEHPEIAMIFHKGIVNVLAFRVIHTNYELLVVSQ